MKKLLWILGSFLCFFQSALAIPVDQLPLNIDPVVDEANILSTNDKKKLDDLLRHLWLDEKIMQGGVVIVNDSDGKNDFDYGMDVFQRWELGNKESNNGLLLLIVMDDHKIRLITGRGLEGAIPDISAKVIIDEKITPAFKQQKFFQGIYDAMSEVARRLQMSPEDREAIIAAEKRVIEEKKQKTMNEWISIVVLMISGIFSAKFFRRMEKLREKDGLRFLLISIPMGIVTLIGYFISGNPVMFVLGGLAIFVITAITGKVNFDELTEENDISSFSSRNRDRRSDDYSSRSSYRGGGGSSGGGGAGGSW